MTILISGAGGSVGTAAARYFSAEHKVLALTHHELDITDQRAVSQIVLFEKPELIINCAVLGVDACEDDPPMARAINVEGPRNLAAAAGQVNAELVHLSSNYVFDGRRSNSPYTVLDEPQPINEYGRTKLEGERVVAALLPRSFVVRTSWVYGDRQENFLSTVPRNLLAGKRLSAIADVAASTTFVADLVRRLGEILRQQRYGTYHVVNSGACSYFEFAIEAAGILHMSAGETSRLIDRVHEAAMSRKAERPRYSPLRCLLSEELGLTPMRDWREALREFVNGAFLRSGATRD
jgi:dTDP-4-dehydrorhamnose reductase